MAFDVWPSNLPSCFILGTQSESFGDGRLRSEVDMGPSKVRRRSTAMPGSLSGVLRMTGDHLSTLRAFVQNALIGGTLPFNFPSPNDGSTLLVRFASLPSWSRTTGRIFEVSIDLEVMP